MVAILGYRRLPRFYQITHNKIFLAPLGVTLSIHFMRRNPPLLPRISACSCASVRWLGLHTCTWPMAWSVDINTFYKHDLHVKTDILATMSQGFISRVYVYVFVFSCCILTLLLSESLRDVTIHSLITIYIPILKNSSTREISLSDEQMEVIWIISIISTSKIEFSPRMLVELWSQEENSWIKGVKEIQSYPLFLRNTCFAKGEVETKIL